MYKWLILDKRAVCAHIWIMSDCKRVRAFKKLSLKMYLSGSGPVGPNFLQIKALVSIFVLMHDEKESLSG